MKSLCLAAAMLFLLSGTAAAQEATALPALRFRSVLVEGMATVRDLQKTHGPEGFEAILHLNRIDLDHLRQNATLIVPESPVSLSSIAPFPRNSDS